MKKIIKINEEQLGKIVKSAVTKVLNEDSPFKKFEEGTNLGDLIMKLYQFGVDLNTDKSLKGNPQMIGSIIMETCKRMMELYNNKDMENDFKTEFARRKKQ